MCTKVRFHPQDIPNIFLEALCAFQNGDEIVMHVDNPKAALLVERNGQIQLLPWGNKSKAKLPKTGFCKEESIKEGKWRWMNPETVKILAFAGWSHGVWFQVKVGIQGMLVQNRVYMITRPSSHYYKVMTGSERMPALIDQTL